MKRDIQGKFALKNDDYRSVRSLRLTDSTWEALGIAAESSGITRADLLEELVRDNDHFVLPCNTQLVPTRLPNNTRTEVESQPSITRLEAEIERLKAEVRHLSEENTFLVEQGRGNLLVADLETLRTRVLKDLKLGKQAQGFKAAQKALGRFIAELTRPA